MSQAASQTTWPPARVPIRQASDGLSPDPADPGDETAESLGRGQVGAVDRRQSSVPIRRPGPTATSRDLEKTRLLVEEQVRRERPDLNPASQATEAGRRFDDLCRLAHPDLPKQYARLMQSSWCPNRAQIRDHVEVKAVRQIPEVAELEEALAGCAFGRPSSRRLAVATLMRLALGDGRPEIRAAVKDFKGSDRELDWAYLDTVDVAEIQSHLRDETSIRRSVKGMLERNSSAVAIEANMAVVNQIAARHKDPFTYLAIDATPIEAHLEQVADFGPAHARLMNRGTGARFGHHGGRNRRPKSWRGWKLLILSSTKLGLGLVAKLIPASEPEYPHTIDLLERFFHLADPALLPAGEIYLAGDSEYDRRTRLAFDLQSRYGVVPVFDLRATLGRDWEWAATSGVPHCVKHGPMKLLQSENFMPEAVPLAYEENFDEAKRLSKARTRWQCQACRQEGQVIRATTWFAKNARLYTQLPRGGDHSRYALRLALMSRRNGIESINSQLKHRGIGGRSHFKAKWVSRQVHMEWLCYLALAAMSFRRQAHETGLYARSAAEAESLALVKEPLAVPQTALESP